MIYIGVTGWRDHDLLYRDQTPAHYKLEEYASHFLTVEVDSSFYAIQPRRNMENWVKQTPPHFRFVVKAYQGMTGHLRGDIPFASHEEMFHAFKDSLQPMIDHGKLATVLFQFPPWFDCKREHVSYLRKCRRLMEGIPIALEFRNQTWFSAQFRQRTLRFMRDEGWIHTICDEPQAGVWSVPIVLEVTNPSQVLIRMHGRNEAAWRNSNHENWRRTRYLYCYNKEELLEWKENILNLQQKAKDIDVLFNNNSSGDAAQNAKELITLMNITYEGLAPKQLGLFG